jgi:hypothetical protein
MTNGQSPTLGGRPRFPGFPVEVGGFVELHAVFPRRKPHTWYCLMLRNRKSGFAPAYVGRKRWGVAPSNGFLLRKILPPREQSETKIKAFEDIVFGPCTLGRTWGTRPEPERRLVSQVPYKPISDKSVLLIAPDSDRTPLPISECPNHFPVAPASNQ